MIIREVQKEDIESIRKIYSMYYFDESTNKREDENVFYFTNKVNQFVDKSDASREQNFYYLLAEDDNGGVIGVAGSRRPHSKLMPFATTSNPAELYSLFVNQKGEGIGKSLVNALVNYLRVKGSGEMIVHSGSRWKDSWEFYDKIGFKRVGTIKNEDDSFSQIWSLKL